MSKMGFVKLWFKIVWKMRTVYCSLAVHAFDILTDALVIIAWLEFDEVQGDNINARTMAICAIGILLFHKIISVSAFWAKERNIMRCLLQFFDLLIFEEIYASHKTIITEFKNKSKSNGNHKSNEAIETTSTFKFVRNLEAIFESIPQSVLQLVFIIRVGWKSESKGDSSFLIISILSILQSIISMTNSVLKNDNIYMAAPKWKRHKKRFPPSIPFLKHGLSRLSEVIYRISICALFWTVCGSLAFGILMAIEILILVTLIIWWDVYESKEELNVDDLCLRVQALILLPSEFVYAEENGNIFAIPLICNSFDNPLQVTAAFCVGLFCCCYTPTVLLTSLCHIREQYYMHITFRIGISMEEWIVIILWAVIDEERSKFLFSFNHGLSVFIIGIICFLIYTQYLYFFPKFALPNNIAPRSKFGYAFMGELEELQRLKVPNSYKDDLKYWDEKMEYLREDTYIGRCTCALAALAMEHYHVLEWLEKEKGATLHKTLFREENKSEDATIDYLWARSVIGKEHFDLKLDKDKFEF